MRVATTQANTGAANVGLINLTDLKSGTAWSTVANSKISGTLGSVYVTKVGDSGGAIDFSGGLGAFNGTISGASSVALNTAGAVSGTIQCDSLGLVVGGNCAAEVTCQTLDTSTISGSLTGRIRIVSNCSSTITIAQALTGTFSVSGAMSGEVNVNGTGPHTGSIFTGGAFSGEVTIAGDMATHIELRAETNSGSIESLGVFSGDIRIANTMNGNITFDGAANAGSISLGTMNGDLLVPNGALSSTLTIGTMTGDISVPQGSLGGTLDIDAMGGNICATNLSAGQMPSALFENVAFTTSGTLCGLPAVDCNGNEYVNATDVSTGRSHDYDSDNVPDECECASHPIDTDDDGDVDLSDFAVFLSCFNGPNRPWPGPPVDQMACVCTDWNQDDDVDLTDFSVFLLCFNGPNQPPPDRVVCNGLKQETPALELALDSNEGGDDLDSIDVTFSVVADAEGQEITAGTPIHWQVIVTVTGDNAGLASYDLDLELRQGSATGSLVNTTLAQPALAHAFNVGGNAGSYAALGGAPLNAGFLVGGPRLSATSVGAQETGVLIGFGAGYTPPWAYTPKSNRLTPGVGLAASKADLLYNPQGEYVLHTGTLDTTGLSAGHYVLRLVPGEMVNVLQPELDYTTNLDRNFTIPAGSVSEPDTAEFDVVEQ